MINTPEINLFSKADEHDLEKRENFKRQRMKGFILLMVLASKYAKGIKTISSYKLRSKITFFDLHMVQRLYKIKLFHHGGVA